MRLTLKQFINLLSEKHLGVNATSLVLLTSNQSITWTHLKLHYVNALMKIHNNYYSLQPFIFYEVAYKLSSEYVLYFLIQLVFSEPNLHARIFIFIQAYLWNHGASVTCINDGNSKFWLRHRKEKALISLVVSFIMIGWKLLYRPECFIMHCVFYYLKTLFCNTWKFCKLCYHGHNILCISI